MMDKSDILVISLRNLVAMGEKLLQNLYDHELAFEFFKNTQTIRKYIFEKHYHNGILRDYYNFLPKFEPEFLDDIQETNAEKILRIRPVMVHLLEELGINVSPKSEKKRDEVMILTSQILRKTRDVL